MPNCRCSDTQTPKRIITADIHRIFAVIGGILLAVGFILFLITMCLCAHAWCVWYVTDREVQTVETSVLGGDHLDHGPNLDWFNTYDHSHDKTVPNGVLRDGRQSSGTLKKHVTISPRSDSFSSGYMSGRQGEYGGKGHSLRSQKSGPGSVTSDVSTLASFAYLHDPTMTTPYSTINQQNQQRRQVNQVNQSGGNVHNVPMHIQDGYGSVGRGSEVGRTAQVRPYYTDQTIQSSRSNVLPNRRHSDDDYDNAGDVTALLPHQTFYQQQPLTPSQQQDGWRIHDNAQYNQQWQQPAAPPQQTTWQYQSTASHQQQQQQQPASHQLPPLPPQHQNVRNSRTFTDDIPVAQPLVRPSQRRPMTFEQISSSKVSLYDNIHMNRADEDEE